MRRLILAALVLLAAAPAFAQEDTDAADDTAADEDCVCTVGEPVPACKEVCDPTPGGGRASCSFVP